MKNCNFKVSFGTKKCLLLVNILRIPINFFRSFVRPFNVSFDNIQSVLCLISFIVKFISGKFSRCR